MTADALNPIRAVFFDAVGTLLNPSPSAVTVYHRVGRELGSQMEREVIAERFRRAFAWQEELDHRQGLTTSEQREVQRWRAIVGEVLDDVARPEECFQTLYQHFARSESWAVHPDAERVLDCLAESGYRLGICSNFDHRLRDILAGLPSLRRLRYVIVSSEVGWRKPAPGFFARLSAECGLPAEKILIVGDDLENDYWGARRAGMPALLFDPEKEDGNQVEERIDRLAEVSAWLQRKQQTNQGEN